MEFLLELWLPILLSAVFVFLVSSVLHMLLPIHKGDHRGLSDEEGLLGAMREKGLEPGTYMFPFPKSMKEMGSPEMLAKYEQGPVGFMTVFQNGAPAMGKNLLHWFLYSILISVFVAYITWLVMVPGQDYMDVFRVTGTIAVMGYGLSDFPASIWKGQAWSTTFKFLFDGIIYGLVTAGTFAWLWPGP
jgi:hypothetical protein